MNSFDKRRALIAPALVLALFASACDSGSDNGDDGKDNAASTSPAPSATATAASASSAPPTEASTSAPAETGKQGGTFRLGLEQPTAIDPYNVQDAEGLLVAQNLFTGLVTLERETLAIKPGVAKSWKTNADCTEWTFDLMPGTKFSNGEAVTAKSFIAGWTRAVPASDVAYHLAGIAGFDQLQGGKAKEFAGLSAPNDDTLVVQLSAADCEFHKKPIQPIFSPVPSDAGAADNATYNDMPIGNGPFKLKEPWQHDRSITLVRNDEYFGEKAHLDEVAITLGAIDQEYKAFQGGDFDWARIPPELIPAAEKTESPKGNFIKANAFGINYLLPMTFNGPLKSADARKAISYAIDRDKIIAGVFKGAQVKATSLIPPAFKDYVQEGVCEACTFDPVKAKEHAAKAGLTPGTELYFGYNAKAGHEAWTQAVAQQLQETLGLKVKLEGMPGKEMSEATQQPGATGMYRFAWGADYPTPENFLAPMLSKRSIGADAKNVAKGDNRGRYDNPAFDALLVKAQAAKTDEERIPIIKAAEKIAIGDDLALIPLWYRTQYRAFDSSKWAGVEMDFFENPTLATISQK